jgi:hypothetical protein
MLESGRRASSLGSLYYRERPILSCTNRQEVDDKKDVREYLRTLGGVIRQPADSAACYDLQWRKRSI